MAHSGCRIRPSHTDMVTPLIYVDLDVEDLSHLALPVRRAEAAHVVRVHAAVADDAAKVAQQRTQHRICLQHRLLGSMLILHTHIHGLNVVGGVGEVLQQGRVN